MTLFITPARAQTAHPPAGSEPTGVDAHGGPTDGTHSEVGHETAGHGGAFPPFDASTYPSQLLWLVIAFAVFYRIVSKTAAPRISAILEVRHDRIAGDLEEAERMRAETDAAIAAYEQSLAEARQKAGAIAAETRETVSRDLDARRAAIEADLTAKLAAAEAEIARIKSEAMAEVSTIATETTEAIVGALIGGANRAEAAAAVETVRAG